MSKAFKHIKGTFDVVPEGSRGDIPGSAVWQAVEAHIRTVLGRFCFHEIRTPILEETQLIARGIGALTDIVTKEMFAFERGKEHYVLRPELTAPVMRAYLQHQLGQRGGAQKLYYLGPCFRAERPQKGRYRQFHQFGGEIIGAAGPEADAEIIAAMMTVYTDFGLTGLQLRLNTLGSAESRPRYKKALQAYFQPFTDQLSPISQQRLAQNPLRILDTKNETERALLKNAPLLLDFIDEESLTHYTQVKTLLADLGVAFVEDPFLVRGLDYYTHTAFELVSTNLGAQSALAGGGRYDLLALELGSKTAVPGIGFAAGLERLFIELAAQGVAQPEAPAPDVFLVALGADALRWAIRQADGLRQIGLRVELDLLGRSMKAQMREANRQQAATVVIVGETELAETKALVKDMKTGAQTPVPFAQLTDFIAAA